jgi:exodeoxyribonuclease VII large subunit
VSGLYEEVDEALRAAFPRRRPLWVRGEIQSCTDQAGRAGHCYLDLVDPDDGHAGPARGRAARPTLKVKCWKTTWLPLKRALAKEGITLAAGMVVVLRGTIDVYPPKGEISLVLQEIDVTALLGRLAARRAALLQRLESEGLLRANAAVPVPPVPLRIGLVASPGTEGYRDFTGQLSGAPFAFDVNLKGVSVQGAAAPGALAAAVRALCRTDCDLIVVVRGGGSKADLAAFDDEAVARTIATATKPVWTGIGHTGDESVSDIVANRCCITPTECGQHIVQRVEQWWGAHVAAPAGILARCVPAVLDQALGRDADARHRLTRAARAQLGIHRERLGARVGGLARLAPAAVETRQTAVRTHAARLGPLASGHLAREGERVRSWRRLLTAYDVDRQLERGYTLTLTERGALVRSISDLPAGTVVQTRLADGTALSRVESTAPRPETSSALGADDDDEGPGSTAAAASADAS